MSARALTGWTLALLTALVVLTSAPLDKIAEWAAGSWRPILAGLAFGLILFAASERARGGAR